MKIRLDKFLADMGFGTRSQVRQQIAGGNVTVNGLPARRPELKVDTDKDRVLFCGTEAAYAQYEYYMLNKPAGVVSATEDKKEHTVLDLLQERKRKDLFPVGRLDKDTEGLLLITNNGDLAHRLLAPGRHVDKVYYAEIDGKVTREDAELFRAGVDIGDKKRTMPAFLEILSSADRSEILLTIREGRFHQVKRMFHAVGKEVLFLRRIQMGPLKLDEKLRPGEYRRLTKEEVEKLC
ncbi:MAG TPA: rRNA pseudouridine synthase [Candidatus Mediterraneibacter norwichensis]|nr:rRNA pseudouridine synthase [Candidatus Mediterraneibacter norwichensis]